MHRVFADPPLLQNAGAPFAALRAFIAGLGLTELCAGGSFLYLWRTPGGRVRQVATLWEGPGSATFFLYPDALGRGPGAAMAFYRALEEAGIAVGSTMGPSIRLNLSEERHLQPFRAALAALVRGAATTA